MNSELILKFEFTASHSLSGYELPHPHIWKLKIVISGKPIEGKIIDIVKLRQEIEIFLRDIDSTFLNENKIMDFAVRKAPTCETLSQYFWNCLSQILQKQFLRENPSVSLKSVMVTICDLNHQDLGAVRIY